MTGGDRSSGGLEQSRTCDDPVCALDPCPVHRRDDEAVYHEQMGPAAAPTCQDCGIETINQSTRVVVKSDIPPRKHYRCPSCGADHVVDVRPAQRNLSDFRGDRDGE